MSYNNSSQEQKKRDDYLLSENIHLTKKEYENILDLYFGKKSYALVFSEKEQCYLLFIHGSKNGYVLIDNNYITLTELGKMLES